ncbi:methylenetetrahydrofolate reductase (NAD(P)H) MET12 [Ascoidea rubescens DSM 1968]|uniref:Methylenetetrahydrofolate reduct n=1 Tax=Ascoidea rubescens DSM 1968 TaxID=1344418 RepID=A0A1D2VNE1_9ASCO|nr:methylenetetrahydrofolate reduct [Ascoidea rubescens DSM 1968]ODV63104.1 methylenetetrahydrofolate reduct [Ascoidea rubescens DSM 1968]
MSLIVDKINNLNLDDSFISLEFFPPKTEAGLKNLLARIERLSVLNPLFVNITWGAGGSTAEKSLELAAYCQKVLKLTTCLHLTCTNTNKRIIDDALLKAKKAGIRNILALRGDPPRSDEHLYKEDSEKYEFNYAIDLIKYIKEKYEDYFCIGVAAYPEGHVDGSYASDQDYHKDIPYLVDKIKAGGDFIITQLFYDYNKYLEWEKEIIKIEEIKGIPIIPALMPINSFSSFNRASKLSHASIPKFYLNRFSKDIINDDNQVKKIGNEILIDIINNLYNSFSGNKIKSRGIHFYTLNLEKSIAKIVTNCRYLTSSFIINFEDEDEEFISNNNNNIIDDNNNTADNSNVLKFRKHHENLINNRKEIANDPRKSIFSYRLTPKTILEISAGSGTLGKEATWDEFPNGRFGDSRSPAYGEIDGYGPSIKIPIGIKNPLIELWGFPQNIQELSKIFINYLLKKIKYLPFSDLEINPETLLIQEFLIEINSKGWLSIASQPSINGCNSYDKIIGWGPRNGFVYQKSFIEILVSKDDWENVLKPKITTKEISQEELVGYYVTNHKGDFYETNLPEHNRSSAVTWGVFPNREIIQTTLLEEESFKVWKDELYKILLEWSNLYLVSGKNSKSDQDKTRAMNSFKLIRSMYDSYYLVQIFHNDFSEENALWDLLLE